MPTWRGLRNIGLNQRERYVLMLLTAAFLAGSGVAWLRRAQASRASLGVVTAGRDTTTVVVPAGPLDLNTATARQLDALPGIGPVIAARMVGYRERNGGFRSVNDLRRVPGIGPKRFAALQDLITVGPRPDRDSGK